MVAEDQHDFGMAQTPLRHHGRKQVHGGGDAADPYRCGLRVQQALQVFSALRVAVEQPFNLGTRGMSGGGQTHVMGAAFEQRHAHQRFQLADGCRQGGLAQRQGLGGAAEAGVAGHFLETAQLAQRGLACRRGAAVGNGGLGHRFI